MGDRRFTSFNGLLKGMRPFAQDDEQPKCTGDAKCDEVCYQQHQNRCIILRRHTHMTNLNASPHDSNKI